MLGTLVLLLLFLTAQAQQPSQKKYYSEVYKELLAKNGNEIAELRTESAATKVEIANYKSEIASLKTQIQQAKTESAASEKEKSEIAVFGTTMDKDTFASLMWTLIGMFAVACVFFAIRFRNANAVTRQSKNSLIALEEEFDEHIKKALEREQKLRRQLQDEINKNRMSDAS